MPGDGVGNVEPFAVAVEATDPRSVPYRGGGPYTGWMRVYARSLGQLAEELDSGNSINGLCPIREYQGQTPLYDGSTRGKLINPPGGTEARGDTSSLEVDVGHLSAVHDFASTVAKAVETNQFPGSLESIPNVSNIRAIELHLGSLAGSRAIGTNAPGYPGVVQNLGLRTFLQILRKLGPTYLEAQEAGVDTIEIALSRSYPGKRGYFACRGPDESAPPESRQRSTRKAAGQEFGGLGAETP
ncbi:hypothetical protein DL768_004539 [Monosporascus sp. mg162]|nr:hypothetical protein DL768_004539 [Monosporascus sp. mg162]